MVWISGLGVAAMTPYRFDIEHRSNGSYVVRCGGLSASSEAVLARRLVEDDAPDAPIEGGRVGKADWTFHSLHRFAVGAVKAGEDCLYPALQAAVVARAAALAAKKKEAV